MRLLNITPGVNQIMDFELKDVDNENKIKMTHNSTVVFIRPVVDCLGSNNLKTVVNEKVTLLLKSIEKLELTLELCSFGLNVWGDISQMAEWCDKVQKEISKFVPG